MSARQRLAESFARRRAARSVAVEPETSPRRTMGRPVMGPLVWAVVLGVMALGGLGAFLGVLGWRDEGLISGGAWLEWMRAQGSPGWQASARAAAVIWGYYGFWMGVGFAVGALRLDGAISDTVRNRFFLVVIAAGPLGRVGVEYAGGLLDGRMLTPYEWGSQVLPGLGLSLLAVLWGMAMPLAMEPSAHGAGGRLDRFGPEADDAYGAEMAVGIYMVVAVVLAILGLVCVF
ncbi:MAG: hypothetical protein KF858_05965 [Candidatus Sumerlaeia bacterium]|nr:hypothetical protein [Candidatus Sumerlaeia bacterium]